jgi:hypothetical protein
MMAPVINLQLALLVPAFFFLGAISLLGVGEMHERRKQ